jgi:hypothetical protein
MHQSQELSYSLIFNALSVCSMVLLRLQFLFPAADCTIDLFSISHPSKCSQGRMYCLWSVGKNLPDYTRLHSRRFHRLTPYLKSIILWDMPPCSPLSFNRRFGRTYRLHLQGRRNKFSKKPASKQMASFFVNILIPPLLAPRIPNTGILNITSETTDITVRQ